MGSETSIEWTNATWNPVRGCRRVSPGCENCYAEVIAGRFSGPGMHHEGLATYSKEHGARWTGDVRVIKEKFDQPLNWKKGRMIFTNSTSDLFYKEFSDETIAAVFGIMATAKHHTFQVLTKRADRLPEWFAWVERYAKANNTTPMQVCLHYAQRASEHPALRRMDDIGMWTWPRPNIWLGVSVENQRYADERVPRLIATPAAVRFVSYEPALGPVDLTDITLPDELAEGARLRTARCNALTEMDDDHFYNRHPKLDWVIVGGESGRKARSFHAAWARTVVSHCKSYGVPVFVKQMGRNVRDRNDNGFQGGMGDEFRREWPARLLEEDRIEDNPNGFREEHQGALVRIRLKDAKGGDPQEWPEDLRIREWPTARAA
jgi:protein gp37